MNKVELTDGQILPADIVIVGIGTIFYTDWLKESVVKMRNDGSVIVNKVQLLGNTYCFTF